MMLFISPAKNIKPKNLDVPLSLPKFVCEAEELLEILKTYNDEDIMNLMKVNAKLAIENQERFQRIKFDVNGTHALSSYQGIQYKYMEVDTWTKEDLLYANDHLRIISGFYGALKPLDSIYPYRLEMQTRLKDERIDNLYSYWNTSIMEELRSYTMDKLYVNLASKEYSEAITPYLLDDETCIHVFFKVFRNGSYRVLATEAKMARGSMVSYCIKNRIDDVEGLKGFKGIGYEFNEDLSDDHNFYFTK